MTHGPGFGADAQPKISHKMIRSPIHGTILSSFR
jgi:hypothetical protein